MSKVGDREYELTGDPQMAEDAENDSKKKPRRRGPKPSADLDAVTKVGAEFRAYIEAVGPPVGAFQFPLDLIRFGSPEAARLAAAATNLTEDQRRLALALCEALSK